MLVPRVQDVNIAALHTDASLWLVISEENEERAKLHDISSLRSLLRPSNTHSISPLPRACLDVGITEYKIQTRRRAKCYVAKTQIDVTAVLLAVLVQ